MATTTMKKTRQESPDGHVDSGHDTHDTPAKLAKTALNAPEPLVEQADSFWSRYLEATDKENKAMVDNWKGDTDGILVLAGLFSAVVATFLSESYQKLSPDSGNQTVDLLTQLIAVSNGDTPTPSKPFRVSPSTVAVNTLWFASLILSLTSALGATVVQQYQQWARSYTQATVNPEYTPLPRGRMRASMLARISRFQMAETMQGLFLLLHSSIFLFFIGIVVFLIPLNAVVAYISLGLTASVGTVYITVTFLPILITDSPFRTPLSPVLWRILYPGAYAFYAISSIITAIVAKFTQRRVPFFNMARAKHLRHRFWSGLESYSNWASTHREFNNWDVSALVQQASSYDFCAWQEKTDLVENFTSFLTLFTSTEYREDPGPKTSALVTTLGDSWAVQHMVYEIYTDLDYISWTTHDSRTRIGTLAMKAMWALSRHSPTFFENMTWRAHARVYHVYEQQMSGRNAKSLALSLRYLRAHEDREVALTARVLLAVPLALFIVCNPAAGVDNRGASGYAETLLDEASQRTNGPYVVTLELLTDLLPYLHHDVLVERLLHPALQRCVETISQDPTSALVREAFMRIWEYITARAVGVSEETIVKVAAALPRRPNYMLPPVSIPYATLPTPETYQKLLDRLRPLYQRLLPLVDLQDADDGKPKSNVLDPDAVIAGAVDGSSNAGNSAASFNEAISIRAPTPQLSPNLTQP